jgi:hypothetical protein
VEASAQFVNRWRLNGSFEYSGVVDTRALRGGPALRLSDVYTIAAGGGSDSSRRTTLQITGLFEKARTGGTGGWVTHVQLGMRPTRGLLLAVNTGYQRSTDDLQYVATPEATDGPRWVLGRINQRVLNITFRANLTLTPELTIQYYGSPFIATGRYGEFKKATDTLAPGYEDRFHRYTNGEISLSPGENVYRVTEGAGTSASSSYSFANPDFNFTQFRSNLVVRWEYKPGSSLFLVWSQGRTGYGSSREDALGTNWNALWSARPDNVLLVKAAYWFSL